MWRLLLPLLRGGGELDAGGCASLYCNGGGPERGGGCGSVLSLSESMPNVAVVTRALLGGLPARQR